MEDRKDPAGSGTEHEPQFDPPPGTGSGMSMGLFHSLTLVLIGVSLGVFWREVFQLTIKMIASLT